MTDGTIITICTALLGTVQTLGTLWIRQIVNKNSCNGEKCKAAIKDALNALQSKSTPAVKEV